MDDHIMDFLDIADPDSEIIDMHIEGNVKYVTLRKKLTVQHCPLCQSRLHSKGQFTRKPNNQVFQDGYTLDLTAIGRRWFCSNEFCDYTTADEFQFIEPHKKNTKATELMVLYKLKNLNRTCVDVAVDLNISDTTVRDIFMRYVDLPRKQLTEIISIDEVYLNISDDCKYALVIMDFKTGDILDIIRSRREEYTAPYFNSIPLKERLNVKLLVCDMYNPYISYTKRYFLHSEGITDSFHVIQWLIKKIGLYVNQVKKRYQARDRKALAQKNSKTNRNYKTMRDSDEVYILKHGSWVLFKNEEDIEYKGKKLNKFLDEYLDTYDWQNRFLALDPKFPELLKIKNQYRDFNNSHVNDRAGAEIELAELAAEYKKSKIDFIKEFGQLLHHYRHSILNSFEYLTVEDDERYANKLRRISNGPMESFNNKPSGYRTQSRGVSSFEFTRNRILWAERDDPSILAVPKTNKQIHNAPEDITDERRRGPYNKKKK